MAFGGLIGWLFNWKCIFSCRISSNIANYLKYNYFCDGDGISNVILRLWTFLDFYSRHIVGVAGDDIMFHILVITYYNVKKQIVEIVKVFMNDLLAASCTNQLGNDTTQFSLTSSEWRYLKELGLGKLEISLTFCVSLWPDVNDKGRVKR